MFVAIQAIQFFCYWFRVKEAEHGSPSKPSTSTKPGDLSIYDASTDDEEPTEANNHAEMSTSDTELPELPDLFRGKKFFFYGKFDSAEQRKMRRLIIAYNG